MQAAVIINPTSGARGDPGAGRRRAELARHLFDRQRVDAEVFLTDGPGAGRELARRAVEAGARTVFAWGGDGTVNEVADAVAFGPAALAIIPAGSGNGLARELGIPRDPERAIEQGLRGLLARIDVGEIAGRRFFNVAGIGLDAWVAARLNRGGRRRGFGPIFVTVLDGLVRYEPREYTIEASGFDWQGAALLVAAANSRQYGYGAVIAPQAQPDDGVLDLVVVEALGMPARLWQVRRLFDGTVADAPGVWTKRFSRLSITSKEPLLFHADGEVVEGGPSAEIRVHPEGLAVRRPAFAGSLLHVPVAGAA
jgi:YegS/Rv2252/BmrU family lipid kinase